MTTDKKTRTTAAKDASIGSLLRGFTPPLGRSRRALALFTALLAASQLLIPVAHACANPTTLSAPSAPSSYTYSIGQGPYSWTVPAWTQSSGCSYTETLTMTPSASWISIDSSSRVIKVLTTDVSLHGTSTTFTVTSTVNDNSNTNNNGYSFTVALTNPCKTATLNSPSLSNMSVDDGSSATQNYSDVADTWYTDYGNPSFCGARTFTIETTAAASVSWASVAVSSGTTYTITIAPTSTNTELQTTHNLRLKVVSDTYSGDAMSTVYVNFDVTVNTPACNCDLQPWDDGTTSSQNAAVASTSSLTMALPSVNANAYTSAPAMRSCTSGSCATTGTWTAVTLTDGSALPNWITWSSGATTISVTPADGTVIASNPWVIKGTYTPTKGSSNPSFNTISITVTCEITSFAVSNEGTTSISYNVFDPTKIIDGSGITYTQSPACGYAFTNSWTYTIPSGNA